MKSDFFLLKGAGACVCPWQDYCCKGAWTKFFFCMFLCMGFYMENRQPAGFVAKTVLLKAPGIFLTFTY